MRQGRRRVFAGPSHDTVAGGRGADVIFTGAGPDELLDIENGRGEDIVHAGSGSDSLFDGPGSDTYEGGSGHDNLDLATGGANAFVGGSGRDGVGVGSAATGQTSPHGGFAARLLAIRS